MASTWAGLASTAFRAAANSITSIPPPDPDLPLLRRLFVLGQLSTLIYSVRATDVGATQVYTLPLARKGPPRDPEHTAMVTATLMHVRDVDVGQGDSAQERMETPQKFGVWLVSELGVVVAFRGTANERDMMINLELNPVPVLVDDVPDARVQLHRGFYLGGLNHIEDILSVVNEACNAGGGDMPLWLTGHSLGGAYAAALTVHLLVNHAQHAQLFAGGGGLTTFGSPMVLFSKQPAALWQGLEALTSAHPHLASLQFDHVVNLGDMVPRLLGSNFTSLHAALRTQLQSWLPALPEAQELALHYHPFGRYRALASQQLRKAAGQQGDGQACSVCLAQGGRSLGGEQQAAAVVRMMDLSCSLPVVMAQRAVQGSAVPSYHSMLTYLGDIEAFAKATAAQGAADEAGDDVAALFRQQGARGGGVGGVYARLASEAQGVGRLLASWGQAKPPNQEL